MRWLFPLFFTFAAPVLAAPVFADEPRPFTYADFEQGGDHLDLAICPAPLAAPGRFCRFTAHGDGLNVFVFSEEGDQPLVGFQSWSSELLVGLMD